ncbi:hypothetical protein [Rhodoferax sp. WC2427]|uniref:hypothetical protein n=1 Tax=Rhodoferax sp. WC2427 TaxID=3234144 RepID=UPI0034654F1A
MLFIDADGVPSVKTETGEVLALGGGVPGPAGQAGPAGPVGPAGAAGAGGGGGGGGDAVGAVMNLHTVREGDYTEIVPIALITPVAQGTYEGAMVMQAYASVDVRVGLVGGGENNTVGLLQNDVPCVFDGAGFCISKFIIVVEDGGAVVAWSSVETGTTRAGPLAVSGENPMIGLGLTYGHGTALNVRGAYLRKMG